MRIPTLPSFNPRTHTGCDKASDMSVKVSTVFQSTHPHGVRRFVDNTYWLTHNKFQSTHPHGVRRCSQNGLCLGICFNPRTHTGCDGSWLELFFRYLSRVSIHAPTRGATRLCYPIGYGNYVSIHAPTRGATGLLCHIDSRLKSFNPRTHTGCDSVQSYIL